jgi:hypothetical protein
LKKGRSFLKKQFGSRKPFFWMLRPYQRLFKYSLIVWIRRNIILKIKVRVGESFSPVGVRPRQADNSPTSLSDLIPTYICSDKPLALGGRVECA